MCLGSGGLRLSFLWRGFLYVSPSDGLSVCVFVCVKGGWSLVVFSLER